MNSELFERVLIQLEPELAQEFGYAILADEKKLKVLEIIKEKDVNPIDIRCCNTVEQYNVKENGNTPLTKEEFDVVKEALK